MFDAGYKRNSKLTDFNFPISLNEANKWFWKWLDKTNNRQRLVSFFQNAINVSVRHTIWANPFLSFEHVHFGHFCAMCAHCSSVVTPFRVNLLETVAKSAFHRLVTFNSNQHAIRKTIASFLYIKHSSHIFKQLDGLMQHLSSHSMNFQMRYPRLCRTLVQPRNMIAIAANRRRQSAHLSHVCIGT